MAEEVISEAPAPAQETNNDLLDIADGEIESNWDEVVEKFDDLKLKDLLLRGIYAYGYVSLFFNPPVSSDQVPFKHVRLPQSWPATTSLHRLSLERERRRHSPSLSFSPSMLTCTRFRPWSLPRPVSLPSRFKRFDVLFSDTQVIVALGDFMKIDCHASIGGISVREDARKLESGVHVVVGTPGRVFDMIANRRAFRTGSLKMFVLDEADEMLSRGFKDQIYDIFRLLPSTTQVCTTFLTVRLCFSLLLCPLTYWK